MDTQASLEFTVESFQSKNPIKKEVLIGKRDFLNGIKGEEVISFTEHKKVSVKLTSYNEDVSIELQTADSDGNVVIKNGEEVVITEGKEDKGMYVPGYYPIIINSESGSCRCIFKVEPTSISWEGLGNIRDILESISGGLAYNLYLERLGSNCTAFSDKIPAMQMLQQVIGNRDIIVDSIDNIIRTPLEDIIKVYGEQNYSRRADSRSQRWMASKGLGKNKNPDCPDVLYEKQALVTKDTFENKWLKKVIFDTIYMLSGLEDDFIKIKERLNRDLDERLSSKKELSDKIDSIRNKNGFCQDIKDPNIGKMSLLEIEIGELRKNIDFVEKKLYEAIDFKSKLYQYGFKTWISEVSGWNRINRISKRILSDHRYCKIHLFHSKLIKIQERSKKETNIAFSFKNTSLLFEIYVVILTIQIAREEGFIWKKGWLADYDEVALNGELPKESILIFEKDNLRLELAYDLEIKESIVDPDVSQFINSNPSHRRPDIRLSLFDSTDDKLISSMIIEAKCRRKRYLFSDEVDTTMLATMKSYYSFGYYDSKAERAFKRKRDVIDSVVIVYPKQGDQIEYPYDGYHNFKFIGIEPNKNKSLETGYDMLKQSIRESLLNNRALKID